MSSPASLPALATGSCDRQPGEQIFHDRVHRSILVRKSEPDSSATIDFVDGLGRNENRQVLDDRIDQPVAGGRIAGQLKAGLHASLGPEDVIIVGDIGDAWDLKCKLVPLRWPQAGIVDRVAGLLPH